MKKIFGLLIFGLGFLMIATGGYLYFFMVDDNTDINMPNTSSNNNEANRNIMENEVSELEELDIGSDEVKSLYNLISNLGMNQSNSLDDLKLFPHSDSKMTYESLSKEYILNTVLENIDNDSKSIIYSGGIAGDVLVAKIPISLINSTLKSIYGEVEDFTMDELQALISKRSYNGGKGICPPMNEGLAKTEGEYIICAEIRQTGPYYMTGRNMYSFLIKAGKDDSSIYLYDYYTVLFDDKCYSSPTRMFEPIKVEDGIKCYLNEEEAISKNIPIYKHTFTKDNEGNYYYASSEILK